MGWGRASGLGEEKIADGPSDDPGEMDDHSKTST